MIMKELVVAANGSTEARQRSTATEYALINLISFITVSKLQKFKCFFFRQQNKVSEAERFQARKIQIPVLWEELELQI